MSGRNAGRGAYTLLRDAVFTHPTMREGLGMLFTRVFKRRDAAVEKREYTPMLIVARLLAIPAS
jgi:hypothetical protein